MFEHTDVKIEHQTLAVGRPDLIKEWDDDKNVGLSPETVLCGSSKKIHWICSLCQHKWPARAIDRAVRFNGCPSCRRKSRKFLPETHPIVASEWLLEKNDNVTADQVSQHCKKHFWWRCRKCRHEWRATVKNRAYYGTGCPKCSAQNAAKKFKISRKKKPCSKKNK